MEARRCGDEDRSGAAAYLSSSVSEAAGAPDDARVVDGEAVCERDRREGGRRLRADPRRLRLREGLSGREVFPRCEADHHRRGDERDPAARHRAPVAVAMIVATTFTAEIAAHAE